MSISALALPQSPPRERETFGSAMPLTENHHFFFFFFLNNPPPPKIYPLPHPAALPISPRNQARLTILRGPREDRAERIRQERRAPELDAVRAPAGEPLVAHAVYRGDVTAVGDGVAALDGAPGVELLGAVRRLLLGVPADGRRITEQRGALQRREARALRIPLIPAHERADPPYAREIGRASCRERV